MSSATANPEPCQVDFYLLDASSSDAAKFACRLALMAWEQQQKIYIVAATEIAVGQLDDLLWQNPQGRFLPHSRSGNPESGKAPVIIGPLSGLKPTDVVINLGPDVVPRPERFKRLLEVVPYADTERKASRMKYKAYRDQGLNPCTHEPN